MKQTQSFPLSSLQERHSSVIETFTEASQENRKPIKFFFDHSKPRLLKIADREQCLESKEEVENCVGEKHKTFVDIKHNNKN